MCWYTLGDMSYIMGHTNGLKGDDGLAGSKAKRKFTDDYKFDNGEEVYYIGGLFEKYVGLLGIIKRKSRQKNVNYYQVWFEDLQMERAFMEKFLKSKKELTELEEGKSED